MDSNSSSLSGLLLYPRFLSLHGSSKAQALQAQNAAVWSGSLLKAHLYKEQDTVLPCRKTGYGPLPVERHLTSWLGIWQRYIQPHTVPDWYPPPRTSSRLVMGSTFQTPQCIKCFQPQDLLRSGALAHSGHAFSVYCSWPLGLSMQVAPTGLCPFLPSCAHSPRSAIFHPLTFLVFATKRQISCWRKLLWAGPSQLCPHCLPSLHSRFAFRRYKLRDHQP